MNSFELEVHHPILPEPWTWQLLEFSYRRDFLNGRESFIDLVFVRQGDERRLRFFGPQEIELSRGIPNSSGLTILDVSDRQLEDIKIRVVSFEPDWCVPSFWAAKVVEVGE